jgi:hypothetical protein
LRSAAVFEFHTRIGAEGPSSKLDILKTSEILKSQRPSIFCVRGRVRALHI